MDLKASPVVLFIGNFVECHGKDEIIGLCLWCQNTLSWMTVFSSRCSEINPWSGCWRELVICFLIILRFKSSEAQLGFNFEAAFHYLALYLYWDRVSVWSFLLLMVTQTHSNSLPFLPGAFQEKASRGFGNKRLNYTKQHNATMLSQSLCSPHW